MQDAIEKLLIWSCKALSSMMGLWSNSEALTEWVGDCLTVCFCNLNSYCLCAIVTWGWWKLVFITCYENLIFGMEWNFGLWICYSLILWFTFSWDGICQSTLLLMLRLVSLHLIFGWDLKMMIVLWGMWCSALGKLKEKMSKVEVWELSFIF